jgi:hypothetical protein
MQPHGIIAIWTGALAEVPDGWAVCDGTNGTPNMVNRFLRGAPAGQDPGSTGGSNSHSHTVSSVLGHTHYMRGGGGHSHTVWEAGFIPMEEAMM